MRGRKPSPTQLKLVRGNPGKRPIRAAGEPKPGHTLPEAPVHLSARAKAAWGQIAPILSRMGVLTEADAVAGEAIGEPWPCGPRPSGGGAIRRRARRLCGGACGGQPVRRSKHRNAGSPIANQLTDQMHLLRDPTRRLVSHLPYECIGVGTGLPALEAVATVVMENGNVCRHPDRAPRRFRVR